MNNLTIRFLFASLLSWLVVTSPAQDTIFNEELLKAKFDSLSTAGSYPGATMTIIAPDGIEHNYAYGYSDIEAGKPMKTGDKMLVGSTGKTFVSAVIMQLIDEGKLSEEDRLSDWLGSKEWFGNLPNGEDITIYHLLHHTSGLPRYVFKEDLWSAFAEEPGRTWMPEELITFIINDQPVHPAGKGWSYSDTGYLLLGMVIEEITGNSYYDELQSRILNPFSMDDTSPSDSQLLDGLITGYTGDHTPPFDLPPKVGVNGMHVINPQFEWTGGGLLSNTTDLAVWVKNLYEGRIFSKVQLEKLVKPVDFRTGQPVNGSGYGMGVFIYRTPFGEIWGHGGFFFGYETQLLYLPDHGISIAIQVNADSTSERYKLNILQLGFEIAELIIDLTIQES